MLVIVDIDGSIGDWKPRDKAAGGNPGRADMAAYRAYIERLMDDAKLIDDEPVQGMQVLLRALASRDGVDLVYLTGRSEKHRRTTERWLMLHRFPEARLVMRGPTDWRSALDYKSEVATDIIAGQATVLAIEDEPEVADMLAARGVTVLQVKYKEAA